ncbi:glycoside hydrolase/phage tail family protein [Rhodosalinus sp. FB01]|uniref:baseplate multidomain protein megatron n=1 Tax=Rhodosalinus sp. FB01 TaxID=3239194 RepID=UPI003526184E
MATILLSAAGAALGSSLGGTVLGLSMTAAGRFLGVTLGRAIDARLMGQGSDTVETGRIERFRLTGAGEGAPVPQVYGRMRVGGHVIWASRFTEVVTEAGGGGKGEPRQPKTRRYSYRVSLAVALCEGEIAGVGRVWADGAEIAPGELVMRVHPGSEDQLPDPAIEAIEGAGAVPAYRGTAYLVIEDLDLSTWGNRIPQLSFEVIRHEQPARPGAETEPAGVLRAVALTPGTGEYALATTPVRLEREPGRKVVANVNSPSGETDLVTSLDGLERELPACEAVSLVVSWFGDDLRCGACSLRPKVEQAEADGKEMPWAVAGVTRGAAGTVPVDDGRPVYGGTPTDAAVVEAIRELSARGQAVTFYPFILMEQMAGNTLPDPWTGAAGQPVLPWRGRITLSVAPGREESPDGTAPAADEVAAFFGAARAADFAVGDGTVTYTGPAEDWGLNRFILHYAALCAAAGGVEAFCIGSELRGLTQIRDDAGFPAVARLRALAAEVRALLGPQVKIGYAADWSEYWGYQPPDAPGDRLFHLDPLWADEEIDFVGIDNYLPLSDWRDGTEHADAGDAGGIHDLDYLRANVAGGELFDWFYHSEEARAAQIRTPIEDGAHGEAWIWRPKDIRSWWENPHHERIGGVRQATPTGWVPGSKPIWFTEFGCAAVDKGTNQPNRFLDPKSSESGLPHFSDGRRDEVLQANYYRATLAHWSDPAANPVSDIYGGPMIDLSRCFAWSWDARPWPWFPAAQDVWADGVNYARGHWLNGRASGRGLGSVIGEICDRAGLHDYDVDAAHGHVRGYLVPDAGTARAALQPLLLRHGIDAVERDGRLRFQPRDRARPLELDPDRLAVIESLEGRLEETRAAEAEQAGRVRLRFVAHGSDFEIAAAEAVLPDDATHAVSESEMPLAMTRAEATSTAERWLAEARVARDTCRFALPPSRFALGPGDVVRLGDGGGGALWRIDRTEQGAALLVEAVRVEPSVYLPAAFEPEAPSRLAPFVVPVPVESVFLDLPLMTGDEAPHVPHLALRADPWPGTVAVWDAPFDAGYALNSVFAVRAAMGVTETALPAAPPGRIDRGPALAVRLDGGALGDVTEEALLAGANLVAIGDGSPARWELFQFRAARMLGPDRWLLSERLRGQAGSDGVMPPSWPAGSRIVLMNGAAQQIALPPTARNVARHYRIGPRAARL